MIRYFFIVQKRHTLMMKLYIYRQYNHCKEVINSFFLIFALRLYKPLYAWFKHFTNTLSTFRWYFHEICAISFSYCFAFFSLYLLLVDFRFIGDDTHIEISNIRILSLKLLKYFGDRFEGSPILAIINNIENF